jgi:hypothetical protein
VSTRGSLAPVPSDGASCDNCSAPLVADQRYCLACGHPVSPVRLAFLDVLQSERSQQGAPGALATTPVAYASMVEPSGSPAWLRRYTPLFAVASVLLLALIAGLLVGHWVTQGKSTSAPATQVIKVEGLSAAAPAATATTPGAATPAPTAKTPAAAASKEGPAEEAQEVAREAKAEKQQAAKVEHAAVVKPSSDKLKKLSTSTGKKHEEEINSLGGQPIETGG